MSKVETEAQRSRFPQQVVVLGSCLQDRGPVRVGSRELTEEGLVVRAITKSPSGPGQHRMEGWADSAGGPTWDHI